MKAPLSKNIEKILEENKYDYWEYRTNILPNRMRKAGMNVKVLLDDTELKYFLKGKNITKTIEEAIEEVKNNISTTILTP